MKKNKQLTFSKKIQQICKSRFSNGSKQVIDDMIQLSFNIMTTPMFMTRFPRTRYYLDETMTAEVRRYEHDPQAWQLLQDLVLDFFKAINDAEPFTDVIGSLYDEYLGEVLGQFLTPSDVADALAEFQVIFMEQPAEKQVIGDTCGCGAGSLILAMLRSIMRHHGEDAMQHLEVVAMDLDPNLVRMCSVQVVMSALVHGIPLNGFVAHCGNTLTDYAPKEGKKSTLALAWHPMMSKMDYFEAGPEAAAMQKIMNRFSSEEESKEIQA